MARFNEHSQIKITDSVRISIQKYASLQNSNEGDILRKSNNPKVFSNSFIRPPTYSYDKVRRRKVRRRK